MREMRQDMICRTIIREPTHEAGGGTGSFMRQGSKSGLGDLSQLEQHEMGALDWRL